MRLANVKPGQIVTYTTDINRTRIIGKALLVRHEGLGDARTITFAEKESDGRVFEWEAYRYNGVWALGSSAQRIIVLDVQEGL